MNSSIRLRIGLSVFLLTAVLQICLSIFLLHRTQRLQLGDVNDLLEREIMEIRTLFGTPQFELLVATETQHNSKWNELFFEVVDAHGRQLLASDNVPPHGLLPASPMREQLDRSGLRYWDLVHPRSRKGHAHVRVAEMRIGDQRLRVGRTLKDFQKTYFRLRYQLAAGLVVISVFGALGAWWVAQRALAPIRGIAEEAQHLGGSLDGELPRSGSGDELDQLARVLNEMLARIRGEVARVRRLTADAAHALRTPLTVIRGQVELHLRSHGAQPVPVLESALEAIDEVARQVNQMLLLEQLESEGLRHQVAAAVSLDVVTRDVVEALRVLAEERGLKLSCELAPAQVRGDAGQLRNAIANVLDNALRHTPSGGRVAVSVACDATHACVAIEDSGNGLTPEQLERVFERFYSERRGATGGLGLPIARAITAAHGGTLVATSPAGARFEMRIPRAQI